MTALREEVDEQLRRLVEDGHDAVVAAVIRGDERAVRGWAGERESPDGASLFEIGSITKAFTGVLLADMHLRGEVRLDDPLSAHLSAPLPAWRHREPTLLELATHRTGLPNAPGEMGRRELLYALGLRRSDPWGGLAPHDYARLVAGESPRRAPGGRMRYSSMAVGLLGDALAARAQSTYERVLTERVLEPLGMTSTAITVTGAAAGRLMTGHSRRGRPRPPIEDYMPAAGSLRSTADDMLRFLDACLRPPPDPPGPALAFAQQPYARLGKRLQMGLCWMISRPRRAPPFVWHNGGTWGFRSFGGFVPGARTAAIVMSNTARGVDDVGLDLLGA